VVNANGTTVAPGLIDIHVHPVAGDWNRRAEPDQLDRQLSPRRRHHHDFRGRGPHARPSPDVVGLKAWRSSRARVLDAAPGRREGACRRAGHRMPNGRGRFKDAGPLPGVKLPAKSASAASKDGRPPQDGGGAQIWHPEHDPNGGRQFPGSGLIDKDVVLEADTDWSAISMAPYALPDDQIAASARAASAGWSCSQRQRTLALFTLRTAARDGRPHRVILGTDAPAGFRRAAARIAHGLHVVLARRPARRTRLCLATEHPPCANSIAASIEVGAPPFRPDGQGAHSPGKKNPGERGSSRRPPRIGMTIIDGIVAPSAAAIRAGGKCRRSSSGLTQTGSVARVDGAIAFR